MYVLTLSEKVEICDLYIKKACQKGEKHPFFSEYLLRIGRLVYV